MAKKRSSNTETEEGEPIPFETAMEELSQIVSRLESGQESLDESLRQFERGMVLLRTCHSRLDAAAQRIEIVSRLSDSGEVATEEFDSTATLQKGLFQ